MALVSLHVAKGHLRIRDDDVWRDADIQIKVNQSSDTIVDYLKTRADPTWTETTVPGPVQLAILMHLAHSYEHRGDDPQTDADLWMAIGRLLARFRDPALA